MLYNSQITKYNYQVLSVWYQIKILGSTAQAKKIEALEEQLSAMSSDFSTFTDTVCGLEGKFLSIDERFNALESLLHSAMEQHPVAPATVPT